MSTTSTHQPKKQEPLYTRKDNPDRGRYLVATTDIPKGRLLFCERPLVALQSLGNPVWVCHACKAFVGGPAAALHLLANQSFLENSEVVPCRHGCGQVYCSKECEADYWHNRHQYLCTGPIINDPDHPLIQFKQHAVATNEIFLLVAEWMAAEYSHATANNTNSENPFQDFLMEPWWEIPKDNGEPEDEATKEILQKLCQEACRFWNQHWEQLATTHTDTNTPLHMANIIGACELNSIGIRRRNPLCRDIADPQLRRERKEELLACLQQAGMIGGEEEEEDNNTPLDESTYTDDELAAFLAGLEIHEQERVESKNSKAEITQSKETNGEDCADHEDDDDQDDLDVLFSPMDGTAMCALACKMNHSCDPNVIVMYKNRGWGSKHPLVVHAIALKGIEKEQELCISYINTDAPLETRQAALRHYGFACHCSKCQTEMNAKEKPFPTDNQDDDLFGSEDSDSSNDDQGDNNSQIEENGELALAKTFQRLDTVLNHASLGAIPIQFLAQASAFVVHTAAQTEVPEQEIQKLLANCAVAMQERDFVLATTVGEDLEGLLYHRLQKDLQWPSPAYREAYWGATVTAAVGLAHVGGFLLAMELLDKAIILGLNRTAVEDFFGYVELHAAQMARAPYPPWLDQDSIPDYNLPEYRDILVNSGLSQPNQFAMPELSNPSYSELEASYISKSKPIVVRQYAKEWPSIQKWRSLTFFCQCFGHRIVPIELGSMRSDSGMKEELLSVREFVSTFLAESAKRACWTLEDASNLQGQVAYLAQHPLISQLPDLGQDIDRTPSLCGDLGPSHIYLWIGTGGTRTPLHFDSYSNIFVQVVGVKYIRIYGSEETPKLYVSKNKSYGLQGNMSDVDCEQEDYSEHPLAKDAAYQEVLLFPGDALFIPALAWHYVRSLTTSMSINYWF